MKAPIKPLIDQILVVQQDLLGRSRALRDLVEMSEQGRRARAREVLDGGKIKWIRHDEDGSNLRALVTGRGKQTPQLYSVTIKIQDGQVRGHLCNCHDHGHQGACKHVLAVAGAEVLRIRQDWKRLRGAIEALTGDQDE